MWVSGFLKGMCGENHDEELFAFYNLCSAAYFLPPACMFVYLVADPASNSVGQSGCMGGYVRQGPAVVFYTSASGRPILAGSIYTGGGKYHKVFPCVSIW